MGLRNTIPSYTNNDGARQKFTQKERDIETGLDYFINRYYSSAQGRFTSPDIFGSRRRSPQSWNRYSYVLNNPLRYIDPLGLQAQDPLQQEPKKIDDIVIVNHAESRSWFKRALKAIGGLFKGGSRVQTEGAEEEERESEETREEEKKADEKDLNERSPWRDPNAVPPVRIDESEIAPGLDDPSKAIEMEEASLTPRLNGGTPAEQLRDAVNRVASSEGSPEAKAELMARFASQIRVRSQFDWAHGSGRGTDGSYIFFGAAGYKPVHVVVISPQGAVYVGNYTGFTFSGTAVTPRYDVLKPVR